MPIARHLKVKKSHGERPVQRARFDVSKRVDERWKC